MRSLRQRLAQFDGPARPRANPRETKGELPLDSLLEAGMRWVGSAPTGHLRLEVALGPGLPRREAALPPEAWRRLGLSPPEEDGAWTVVDTETTGLEGGAGTLVFLVGLVHWEVDGARLVQLLMPEPAAEASFLDALAVELGSTAALISYNGRSFDVPRLRSRLRIQKRGDHILDRPHLDLLHPVRPLVRPWLGDCRLVSVEREVLGLRREDDLPGREAPEVYRTLLADRRDTGLARVVEHNAQDVRSLLDLARWVGEVHLESDAESLPASSRLALARALRRRGVDEAADRCLAAVLQHGERDERVAARWELARSLRRARRWEESRRVLDDLLVDAPSNLPAHVELAKLYEHRLGDLDAACETVRRALLLHRDRRSLGLAGAAGQGDALAHRWRRLQRKLSRRKRVE